MARIQPGKNITKKETIIAAAAQLFKTKGYAATSMRELAEGLGVEAPSLYNHIGSKTEILQHICFNMADAFLAYLDEVDQSNSSSINRLELVIRFHIRTMQNQFNEVFVANHEWKHLPEPKLGEFLQFRRHYEKRLMTMVETGIANNEIKPIHPYVAVLTMLSAVRGLEFWQGNKKNVSAQVLENDMVQHLLTGLANH